MSMAEREFQLYEKHLRKETQSEPSEQQISEQLKRSLVERTRSLVVITNASVLGLLQCIPLYGKLELMTTEIENFIGIPKDGTVEADSSSSKLPDFKRTRRQTVDSLSIVSPEHSDLCVSIQFKLCNMKQTITEVCI